MEPSGPCNEPTPEEIGCNGPRDPREMPYYRKLSAAAAMGSDQDEGVEEEDQTVGQIVDSALCADDGCKHPIDTPADKRNPNSVEQVQNSPAKQRRERKRQNVGATVINQQKRHAANVRKERWAFQTEHAGIELPEHLRIKPVLCQQPKQPPEPWRWNGHGANNKWHAVGWTETQ